MKILKTILITILFLGYMAIANNAFAYEKLSKQEGSALTEGIESLNILRYAGERDKVCEILAYNLWRAFLPEEYTALIRTGPIMPMCTNLVEQPDVCLGILGINPQIMQIGSQKREGSVIMYFKSFDTPGIQRAVEECVEAYEEERALDTSQISHKTLEPSETYIKLSWDEIYSLGSEAKLDVESIFDPGCFDDKKVNTNQIHNFIKESRPYAELCSTGKREPSLAVTLSGLRETMQTLEPNGLQEAQKSIKDKSFRIQCNDAGKYMVKTLDIQDWMHIESAANSLKNDYDADDMDTISMLLNLSGNFKFYHDNREPSDFFMYEAFRVLYATLTAPVCASTPDPDAEQICLSSNTKDKIKGFIKSNIPNIVSKLNFANFPIATLYAIKHFLLENELRTYESTQVLLNWLNEKGDKKGDTSGVLKNQKSLYKELIRDSVFELITPITFTGPVTEKDSMESICAELPIVHSIKKIAESKNSIYSDALKFTCEMALLDRGLFPDEIIQCEFVPEEPEEACFIGAASH